MSVGVYKVLPESMPVRRTGFFRVGLWILIAFLVVVAVVATYYPDSLGYETKRALVWVIGGILVLAVVGSYIWGLRDASRAHMLSLEFELTSERLVQHRLGWLSVEIPLYSIRAVHESRDWLIVVGESARISIPCAVAGFSELRQRILADRQVTPVPPPSATRVVATLTPLGAWAVVFLATKAWLIVIAAGVALTLQIYDSFHFLKKLKCGPKNERAWVTAWLVLTWVLCVCIVYFKLAGSL